MDIVSMLAGSPPAAIGLAMLLGLCIGSFLNVVIHRLPRMLERDWQQQAAEIRGEQVPEAKPFNLIRPGSHCPACEHRLRAWENVPLLSWLILCGRCSACKTRISARYPIVELLTGLLSAAAVARYGMTVAGLGALLLTWALIALTFIDFDTLLLPDDITLPLLWLGLLFNLHGLFTAIDTAVLGAAAGYLSLWSVYWIFKLVTGKEGMGYGDFKLLAALGAWLGWQALPGIIVLASAVGAFVGVALIVLRRHGRDVPIPFGPYLASAGLLALHFGQTVSAHIGLA